MMDPIALQQMANASSSVTSNFASATDLAGPIIAVVWATLLVALVSGLRSNVYFTYLVESLEVFFASFVYAGIGAASVAVGVVVMAPAYYLATMDTATQTMLGKYAAYAIGGYCVLAGVGYAVSHYVLPPIMANVEEYRETDADGVGEVSDA